MAPLRALAARGIRCSPVRSVIPYGQYQLLDRLAVGGMAELFLARRLGEAGFQKTCVVKRVLPYLVESPEFVQMFLDEARIAARLNHPGVVQVFELGKHDASYFIAMEYLAGSDLVGLARKAIDANQPLPVEIAVRIGALAADPLHYAHEFRDDRGRPLGIVHRDISPSNLFVTCQGAVKILDFGVAFAHERNQRTETGHVKGKAGYMSPEQCLGEDVDRRTDVWALGVVLYELLSGSRLFEGKTTAQAALQVCQKRIPPIREVRPEVPEAVDAALMRALERDRNVRWPTAQAFQHALEATLSASTNAHPLATYLRDLFGEAWIADQMARTESSGGTVRAGGTEALSPQAASEPTTVVAAKAKPPARPGVRVALATLAILALGGTMLGLLRSQTTTRPPIVVAAPLPVPPPPQEAPKPVVEEAPAPTTRAPRPVARARPAPPPKAARNGRVSIVTQPYARVSFNGKDLGPTPLFDVELPSGKQTLKLVGEDGVVRALEVSVQEAAVTQLRLRLDKLPVESKRR